MTDDLFTDSRIMLAGDWHGNLKWGLHCVTEADEHGCTLMYHLGDFGIWPNEDEYLDSIQYRLETNYIRMIVIPGNHEDYDRLHSWPINDAGFYEQPEHPNIWYAPRGHVWVHSGKVVAALGGAFSIDKGWRYEGISWWPQEEITIEDVEALSTNLNGRKVDLFLSHDCPDGVVPSPLVNKQFTLPQDLEDESLRQRQILRLAVDIAKPTLLVHGHWHKKMRGKLSGANYDTEVWGLNMDGSRDNIRVVDFPDILMLDS